MTERTTSRKRAPLRGRRIAACVLLAGGLACAEQVTMMSELEESTALNGTGPATVTDLAVEDATATSATLTFTEVDDGTGNPASYEIRYAASPIGWGWGGATVVSEGACATPLQGGEIGTRRACIVPGLEPEMKYDFQIVAFRGTLNVDAVFGELSEPTAGATEAYPSAPGMVPDLRVTGVTDASATLAFTQVDDGTGQPADYEVRYALSPIEWGWGSATPVSEGSCAMPMGGTAVGDPLTCDVQGLEATTKYDFQVVAFRGTLNVDAVFGELSEPATGATVEVSADSAAPGTGDDSTDTVPQGCADAPPEWIWCDDFEQDRLASYFEYDDAGGNFVRAAGVGVDGSYGMRARWSEPGQVSAGALHLAFGRTPQSYFRPVDAGSADYREVYWRMYVRNEAAWTGGGADKLSRATIFASPTSWAQAMIAHVWSGSSPNENVLVLDPASGTDTGGNLVTTTYNDFDNLRWLGAVRGTTPLFDSAHVGEWHCVEARARLNDPGLANGMFELWVNGQLDARKTGLNWVGSYNDYGINAVFLENYWNGGAPKAQERFIDNFVVSTEPIGCLGSVGATAPTEEIARLSVAPSADTLNALGYSLPLDATAFGADGNLVSSPSIAWSSLNPGIATVDATGTVIAKATGTARIVATAACCQAVSDTATVVVRQVVASVAVKPSTASLAIGGTLQLTATALDPAGVAIPDKSFAWSSSDQLVATVGNAGLVTALAGGTAAISATSDGVTGQTKVSVGLLSAGGHPNEPPGFIPFAQHNFDAAPPPGPPGVCDILGMIDGCWYEYDQSGNHTSISVSDAPVSPPGVYRMRFPAGLTPGSSPGQFHGWATQSLGSATQFKAIYESGWIRVPTPDFELQAVGVKFLGYIGAGSAGSGQPPSQIYVFSYNPNYPSTTPQSAATIAVVQQDVRSRKMVQNVATEPVFTFGEWHHYEYLMVLNDIGVANGIAKVWWNEKLILEYTDVVFRDASQPSGFFGRSWNPVWGGMGGDSKSRDDYLDIDHLYISGIPF